MADKHREDSSSPAPTAPRPGPAAKAQPAVVFVALLALALMSPSQAAPSVEARGLMRDMAVLIINGRQRVLRVGESAQEGVELLASDPARARVLIDGVEYELGLSERVGANFVAPTQRQVRINRGAQGHFRVAGVILGQSVSFMVDTGATVLAMSSEQADRLGIDYRTDGTATQVITASGPAASYYVNLDAVQVGGISVDGVQTAVVEGAYPTEILLGMSFLRHVQMAENAGVLTLSQEF